MGMVGAHFADKPTDEVASSNSDANSTKKLLVVFKGPKLFATRRGKAPNPLA